MISTKELRSYEKKKLLERKNNKDNLNTQMDKVDLIEQKELLQIMKKLTARKTYR